MQTQGNFDFRVYLVHKPSRVRNRIPRVIKVAKISVPSVFDVNSLSVFKNKSSCAQRRFTRPRSSAGCPERGPLPVPIGPAPALMKLLT